MTINSPSGVQYAFNVDPAIAVPSVPRFATFDVVGMVDMEEPAPLPQRVIAVSSSKPIDVDAFIDPNARTHPLVVHQRVADSPEEFLLLQGDHPFERSLLPSKSGVLELTTDTFATLSLDQTSVGMSVDQPATQEAGARGKRHFAYSIEPEWSGPDGLERRVHIAAAPGVKVSSGVTDFPMIGGFGRRLVHEVVRVPHPDLVPAQGTQFKVDDFVGVENVRPGEQSSFIDPAVNTDKPDPKLMRVSTSLAGVTVSHPWSGATISFRVADRERGAAYAYQVLPPENGKPGEIRAVVGPGVEIEVVEPLPLNYRNPYGATPAPLPGHEPRHGAGLDEQGVLLELAEVFEARDVPAQGTPLNLNY
ncbi:MAG: hypothetical protein JO023_11500, partial [Chloroflexi bacterium]|nr:hypothetical protein [Chloroflexota bacterium]